MNTVKVCSIMLALAFPAIAFPAGKSPDLNAFAKAVKAELTSNFKDPGSAIYRNTFVYKGDDGELALCGEVNSKNSFGGYVGYKPFIASPGYISITRDEVEIMPIFFVLRCAHKVKAIK